MRSDEGIVVSTNEQSGSRVYVDRFPDECPWCHRGVNPIGLYGFRHMKNHTVHISFYCPRLECGKYFVGEYFLKHSDSFQYSQTLLGRMKPKTFSDIINGISPDFVNIFNQSRSAEHAGLGEICGAGYRKALEFLIKDYIIHKDNSLRESVERLLLAKCIGDYITNEKIKSVAKRAAWLGNDETHYVRKWEQKDITDLKLLIDLTVHWIETEALTEEVIASMPE